MQNIHLLRCLFGFVISVAFLAGCSHLPSSAKLKSNTKDSPTYNLSQELIAVDFINAMVQIPELTPVDTTIQLLKWQSEDAFTRAFKEAFEQTGYAIRWVESPSGYNLFQYRMKEAGDSAITLETIIEVAIGDVEFRRSYVGLAADSVSPITPLYVRGADASLDQIETNKTSLLRVPDAINPLTTDITDSPSIEPIAVSSVSQNVFELGHSNFDQTLQNHNVVAEQVLTFANDSLRLGDGNKQLIDSMVELYIKQTDMFSVVGCSMGPTNIKSGNAALALGRASRVKEALLFAGVEPNNILDEGCWAGDGAANSLPRRGVVITLNRES